MQLCKLDENVRMPFMNDSWLSLYQTSWMCIQMVEARNYNVHGHVATPDVCLINLGNVAWADFTGSFTALWQGKLP